MAKRLPISDLPADQPHCQYCDRPLTPYVNLEWAPDHSKPVVVRRTFARWNGYPSSYKQTPRWCRMRCALAFADASYNAGYRRPRKKRA